jgi:hypothetical protein
LLASVGLSPKGANSCKLHLLPPGNAAMPKRPLAALAATLYATVYASGALAVPDFAPTASSAWYSYSREWMPPLAGSGPVMQDKAHPGFSNDDFRATGQQPTLPLPMRAIPFCSLGGGGIAQTECRDFIGAALHLAARRPAGLWARSLSICRR